MRRWVRSLSLLVLTGSALAAGPAPFVVAPVVEGLFECGAPGSPPPKAGSYCAAANGHAVPALRQLLDDLEPGGPRGSVQVGYVLTVQLLGLYRAEGDRWIVDAGKLQRIAELLLEIDRPVVVYLAANHFDSQGPLAQALARDRGNLMLLANGQPPATDYFGYQVAPFTLLTDPAIPVNAYRFEALRLLASRLAALPPAVQGRLVGVALGGELHHLFPDFSGGMGMHDTPRVTDFGEASVRQFRAWLARKYGGIDKLNAAAGTAFGSFDAVAPPARNALVDSGVPRWQHYDGSAGGKLALRGWLWDPDHRVQRLELRVDGRAWAEIERGFNRLDVYRAVADVQDPNVGFRHDLDFSSWPAGNYRLQVVAHSATGEHALADRLLVVGGTPASWLANRWQRALARARGLAQRAFSPLDGVRSALDAPLGDQRVMFNPLARDWNDFRAAQVTGFMGELHRVALAAGLPAAKLFSHQILVRANSSWNADLFATDGSVAAGVPWVHGINMYGGVTGGEWIRRFVRARGMAGYGVPEFHPQQTKRPAAHLEALRLHRQLGARFVSPYYVSIAADRGAAANSAIRALEIRPNNPQEGSDMLFQAIRDMAKQ
ncbi:beta-galactosidase [Caenimonas sedimenti]|nr:beta-galactosidase [Caenimonas sedimenti]